MPSTAEWMNEVLPFRQQTLAFFASTIVRRFDAPFDAGNTRRGPVKTARPSEDINSAG
jgi:hypothetical protein